MEEDMSSQASVTTLQDGRATSARQTWTNAVLEGAPVPCTVSAPRLVTGARKGTAHLQMVCSACPSQGLPGKPRAPRQEWTVQ
ncbi:unnamed protein product [Gulo gulo]|uniref:Uncharacterized protein n=1 Tax=Gulo gulo TaxID=48420 RepID=A0A9X9MB32_GULGU|nr:unnamed protein product [Gulo gulo]